MMLPGAVYAQTSLIDREYEIKAAYLYNFGKYVEWSSEADAAIGVNSPFLIGVVGDNPFGNALENVARAKQLGGRRIVIHGIRTADDYRHCHILFFPRGTTEPLASAVLERARQAPTLLVGEHDGFVEAGGCANFSIRANRVKFEINPDAAQRRGLRISSRLLRLGTIVTGTGKP